MTEQSRTEAELRTLLAAQSALRRVATLVAREGGRSEIFEHVTEEVARLLDARSASVVRFESSLEGVVVGGWSQPGAARLAPGSRLELDGGTAAGAVHRSGEAALVDEAALAPRLRELGFRSALGAPIRVDRDLWGALVVSRDSDEPWPEHAEKSLAEFAELVAQALANAEVRAELAASRARIVEASDAERRRLERNLHDGAQQRLVTLALALRLAQGKIAHDPEHAYELMTTAREELDLALAELRELAHGLHPAVLSDRGLEPALEALASRTPLPIEITEVPSERLPESVDVAVYYLVSEALTNVVKYAQATSATVSVVEDERSVVVEVADDGIGGAGLSAGSGLRGLADRIGALSGELTLESPPGRGTRIRAEIPLGASEPAREPAQLESLGSMPRPAPR